MLSLMLNTMMGMESSGSWAHRPVRDEDETTYHFLDVGEMEFPRP